MSSQKSGVRLGRELWFVWWLDACSHSGKDLEEDDLIPGIMTATCGFYIKTEEGCVHLAQYYNPEADYWRCVFTIPEVLIRHKKIVKV